MRDVFFDKFYDLSKVDRKRIIVSNDFGAPSLDKFRRDISDKYINAGIAEQNIVSISAGMAISGMKPVIYSIASFITARCFEQIKIDLCDMNLPVIIVGVGCGYGYSADGPTHHALEDIGLMSSLPNIKIYSPSDKKLLSQIFSEIVDNNGPVYLRLDRGIVDDEICSDWSLLNQGLGYRAKLSSSQFAVVTTSYMTKKLLALQLELDSANHDNFDLYDLFELNSASTDKFATQLKKYKGVFVVEEHVENTGLGALVHLGLSRLGVAVPVFRYGIPMNVAFAYGNRDFLLKRAGIDNASILEKFKKIVKMIGA